jgi:hypothetical protein
MPWNSNPDIDSLGGGERRPAQPIFCEGDPVSAYAANAVPVAECAPLVPVNGFDGRAATSA